MLLLVCLAVAWVVDSDEVYSDFLVGADTIDSSIFVSSLVAVMGYSVISGSLQNSAWSVELGLVCFFIQGELNFAGKLGLIEEEDVRFKLVKYADLDKFLFFGTV